MLLVVILVLAMLLCLPYVSEYCVYVLLCYVIGCYMGARRCLLLSCLSTMCIVVVVVAGGSRCAICLLFVICSEYVVSS